MPFNMPIRVPAVAPRPVAPSVIASAFAKRPAAPKPPAARPPAPAPAPAAAAPSDQQTATATIQALLKPLIDQITQSEQARAAQGQSLINGYTTNAVDQLKGIDFSSPYQKAATDQNAVNTALLARLGSQGSGLQNQLQGELGTSVGAPATSAVVGRVGADTTGAQNAGLAKGDATLSNLISQGAAAGTYGLKLPGIETLAGLQDTAKLQGAVNSDLSTKLGDIQSQMPRMVQTELSNIAKTNSDQQAFAEKVREFNQSNATAAQKTRVAALIADGKLKEAAQVANANNQTRVQIANAGNQTKVAVAATKAQQAEALAQIKANAAAAKAAGIKPPTADEISKMVDGWKNGKPVSVRVPTIDPTTGKQAVNTAGVPQWHTETQQSGALTYGQAYARLRAMDVADTKARQYLDTGYQKGEQGRAWLTNEQQTALRKAGRQASAGTFKDPNGTVESYLVAPQVAALKKAGLLPKGEPGQLKGAPVYWIAPGY